MANNGATNGARGASGFQSIRTLGSYVASGVPLERQKLRKYSWLPDVLRIEGSVIGRIWGPVLTVTLFSVGVAVAEEIYGYETSLSNSVVPLLSVVVGLLLVFRNGTSYDRYYEGRKDIGSLTSTVRNFSRIVWIQAVPPPPPKQDDTHLGISTPGYVADVKAEKIYLIKLLLSFVYATVHHLRGETGTDFEDYDGVLPENFTYRTPDPSKYLDANALFNQYAAYSSIGGGIGAQVLVQTRRPSSSGRRRLSNASSNHEEQQVRSVPSVAVMSDDETAGPTNGAASERTPLVSHTAVNIGGPAAAAAYLPLPLVIAHEITKTIYDFKKKGYIEIGGPAGYNTMNTMVNSMVDQLTNLERVATTPIPTSYGIHLKQCVTLYLFALPFTLVSTMHWKMIPLVTLVAFTLMGIEGIADEIEMPFGRDQSDLPLERFCGALRSEVEYLLTTMPQATEPSPFKTS
ncbi:hypothetical protein FRC04_000952 [Tulasnella sp. 424]|nr:hypothetical protein FRC04_000952 [Tulasnella sp. 424]KAG8977865.1 hypothetical protein FRC05_000393 [Tulasnella sp. 425]